MKAIEAFLLAKTDKGYVHQYDRYYDMMFNNYTPNSLLEIGVMIGNSLVAWKLMFPNCDINAIDISDKRFDNRYINFSQAKITIGNSTKTEIKDKLENSYDVIIDDGSHYYKNIARTFKNLHTKFNKYYVIEDWPYDINIAKKFLNSYGYEKVTFYRSAKIYPRIDHRLIYRTKKKKLIKIEEHLIVIER